jgi:hypothetical protein
MRVRPWHVTVRLTRQERATLRIRAKLANLTLSAYVRSVLLAPLPPLARKDG